jgi:signal transduction histidine kinase/CheY-like chemotaxis protein
MKTPGQNAFIQAFLPWMPEAFRTGKNPYVYVLALALIGLMLVYAVVNPYSNGCLYPLLYACALIALMVGGTHGLSIHLGIHLASFLGLILFLYGVSQTGGIYSPQLTWSLVLPLTPFFVISRLAGYAWLLITLAAQLAVGLMTRHGWVFEPLDLSNGYAYTSLVTYLVLTVFLMVVPVLYEWMSRDALKITQQHNEALTQKRFELEHISKMREQFISTISHELRTPMNAIMGFTALLTAHFQDRPGLLKILKHSEHSAEHLMTVINDILDYSQLHTGRLSAHAEKFELRELVHYAFELFSLRLEDGAVQYACDVADDVPQWVLTDRHRLMQILVNLLGNAIKFTHQGHVHLRVEQCSQGVRFSVEDSGIGITDEQKPKIFQRYSQADETIQQRFGGNGLGLSISRKLTELLGGEMGFDSTLGVGSTFWFDLPLLEQGAPLRTELSPLRNNIASAGHVWRFLVVDDHLVNRLLVKQVLMNAWPFCEVLEAENGVQAIRQLEDQKVDLVFMDMVMPVMDGTEATRVIRARALGGQELVIVGLTANVNLVDLEVFRAAGLSDVILKPFQANVLLASIDQFLKSKMNLNGNAT